jgi:hypothetical protein
MADLLGQFADTGFGEGAVGEHDDRGLSAESGQDII